MWIDPDWYTAGFSRSKLKKCGILLVVLVLLTAIVTAFDNRNNARCPYCGHRFNIYNLNDMTNYQRGSKIVACPKCGTVNTGDRYWEVFNGK